MKIFVFFTFDVSFKMWVEMGHAVRELLLYNELAKAGHKITFITWGDSSDLNYASMVKGISIIPAYKFYKRPGNKLLRILCSLLLPLKIRKMLKQADIYKTNQMDGSWVAVISKFIFKKKLIVRCGYEWLLTLIGDRKINNKKQRGIGLLKILFVYFVEFFAYTFADHIIVSSKKSTRFITKNFPIQGNKISLLRNFVDTSLFYPAKNKTKIKGDRILAIGRLFKEKNFDNLIEGVSKTKYKLDIIGTGEDEPRLVKLAEKINADVTFLGCFQHNVLPEIIRRYPAFILPSFYENNPKVLLEAMACKLAVIGSNVDGINEIIDHERNGILCDTTPDSITEAIIRLMEDKSFCCELGYNAHHYIDRNCSLQTIVDQENFIYHWIRTI